MRRAFLKSDSSYDGVFFAAVKTTDIFCRPSCPARKPLPANVEFFATAREALFAGYRPCQRCHPLDLTDRQPQWVEQLLTKIEAAPTERVTASDLCALGVDPVRAAGLALVSPSPNPSFGTVTLGFDLPRAGEAALVLYAVDGRRVRTLFAGSASAGRTTLTWDGRDTAGREMPAGAYFARVTFAGEEKVSKVVRLR